MDISQHVINLPAELRAVRIADLKVDPSYQRPLNDDWVRQMRRTFRRLGLGHPTVSERSDGLYVLNGQHRVAMLIELGKGAQLIQVVVYTGLTPAQEQEMFLYFNHEHLELDRRHLFRLQESLGKGVAPEIAEAVIRYGFTLADPGRAPQPGQLGATGMLQKLYTQSAYRFQQVLWIGNAWSDHVLSGDMLAALARLLKEGEDPDQLRDVLVRWSPDEVRVRAVACQQQVGKTGTSAWVAALRALLGEG